MKETNIEIKKILEDFNRNRISYVLLRNYDFLLKDKVFSGGDVDVLIKKSQNYAVHSIMLKNGLKKRKLNPFSKHAGYEKIIGGDEKVLRFHFHIDGVTGRHTRYLEAETILKRRVKTSFFYHTSKEDEFLTIMLHVLLDLAAVKRYAKELGKFQDLDFIYIESQLKKLFSRRLVNELIKISKHKQFSALTSISIKTKKQFELKKALKIARVYVFGAVWKLFNINFAPVVSLTGMDGAGKTTNLENIARVLGKNKIKYKVMLSGRGKANVLPIQFFGKIYRKVSKEKLKSEIDRKEMLTKKESPNIFKKIIYTVAAPVFAFDLFIRYWLGVFPKRFFNEVIITDRYSTDMLLMEHVPMFFKKFLYSLLPKPTKTIYLYNSPEVLFKRKRDQPFYDLVRQEKLFNEMNRKINPTKIKSEAIGETKKKVLEAAFS